MVDTAATISYVYTNLITKLGINPVRREQHCIEQMYRAIKERKLYSTAIRSSVIEGFQLKVGCINAEKDVLTHDQNSEITRIKNQNTRIGGLRFQEEGETQDLFPVYVMLGVTDYQQI